MEEEFELEPFADHEYEPKWSISGRKTLQLRGEPGKRKKVEVDKVPKILETIKSGWDIDVQYADIQGRVDITDIGLEKNQEGRSVIKGKVSFMEATFTQGANFGEARFEYRGDLNAWC